MKASEVFTPGSTPKFTYYERPSEHLEERLLNAVETKGYLTSISGPSKCGKTVLCESVLGAKDERMLLIPGGGITSERLFWNKLRILLDLPKRIEKQRTTQRGLASGTSAQLTLGSDNIAGLSVGATRGSDNQATSTQLHSYDGPNGAEMLKFLQKQDTTLVVDDFHYIAPEVQKTLAQQFKEAARQGTTIVLVSVTERSDQAIRANPDLRGRLMTIDIPFWSQTELRVIPEKGFNVLNVTTHNNLVDLFARESVGSPQLMQALCLELCHGWKLEEAYPTMRLMSCPPGAAENFLKATVALANCKTAFDLLQTGPKVHGSERKLYKMRNSLQGDIYAIVLRAFAIGTPKLSLPYALIIERIANIIEGTPPSGASVVSALGHADQIVQKQLKLDRVLEWDTEKNILNILDPYFLYYLRWSGIATGLALPLPPQ